jgi:hypothetical protein
MPIPQRTLLRLAEKINQQLRLMRGNHNRQVISRTCEFVEDLDRLRRFNDSMALCMERNWNAAFGLMANRVAQNLRDLPYLASQIYQMVETTGLKVPSVREIVDELVQTQKEFDQVEYIQDGDLLVVTTEAIELEGWYLGEFEIQFQMGKLAEMTRHGTVYRVVALDPHPATCNDAVTHPHVSNEVLCEGDASAAIGSALVNGRICDFFQLVNAVLTNYNSGSPYVPLAEWDGRTCYECGSTTSPDESCWCSSCENDFCEDCISYCRRCEETLCHGCLEKCRACDDPVCSSCLTSCPECGRPICKTCLEEGQCPCIQERQDKKENEDEPEHIESGSPTGPTDPATDTPEHISTEAA